MFQTIIGTISSFMYSKLLVILLIGAGVYFTIRTRFPQVRLFKNACGSVMEKPEDKGAISSFQALMVSTASRVGTGNIVGVSSAICIGGFGSVFWMWVIAIIGSASALIESTLAQIYKKKGEDGSCYGGPAYYIEAALHCRPLAIVFCVAMILTYAFGFNMLASYNLQSTFSVFSFYEAKMSPWIIGGILAVLTGWCLLGGGSRIVKVTSMVEKPNVADAKDSLKVKTRKDGDKYFCAYGQYVLTPEVFEALEYNIENNITTKGEIQLTDALDSVRETYGIRGFVFNGKVYDVGTADNYRETLNTFCRED